MNIRSTYINQASDPGRCTVETMEEPPHDPFTLRADETRVRLGSGDWIPMGTILTPMIRDLKRAAHCIRREGSAGARYQTTAIMNEGFVKALRGQRREWNDENHFFNYLKSCIRTALVDAARKGNSSKRAAPSDRRELPEVSSDPRLQVPSFEERVLATLDAYRFQGDLQAADPNAHAVFLLKFAEGLTTSEAAAELGMTERQARRRWEEAKVFLRMRVLQEEPPDPPASLQA